MVSPVRSAEPPALEVHLLGAFQILIGDRSVDQRAWKLRRAHQLVKLLALTHGHQLHRDQLIDRLWPDADGDYALASFHQAVHAARHALEPERAARSSQSLLPLRQQVLALAPDTPLWIDADAFIQAAREARAASSLPQCLAALDLYTGELLPEDLYEDWSQPPRDTVHETYLSLLGFTAQLQETVSDISGAIATLLTLLAADRFNEPAYASLMRLHALSGRRDQAVRLFQQLRDTLVRELGSEPSEDVVDLLNLINAGEYASAAMAMPISMPSPTIDAPAEPVTQQDLSLAELAARTGLVNRSSELGLLQHAWNLTLSGNGQIVFLSGEPGIGKTRLTEAFAEYSDTEGAAVFWARCHQTDDTPAFWLWSQLVRASLRGVSSDELRSDLGSGLAPMAQVVPAVREVIAEIPELPPLDGAQARFRFFASLTDYLGHLAERRPLVLLLDDLQWADPSSVLALEFVADHLTNHRILLLGTLRDTEIALPLSITRALARLGRMEATQRIQLGGFSPEHTAILAESVAGLALSPATATSIYTRTDGNPFFVRELVRFLAVDGRDELQSSTGLSGNVVPFGIREAIMLRLQPLTPEVQSVLATAAIIGSSFELSILAMVSGIPIDLLLDRLDEGVGAGLVEPDLDDVNRFWFSHVMIRDALQAGLLRARQARLHARIGEALEERAATRPHPDYAEIAYHYAEAASAGKVDQAITYLIRAAEQSMTRLAYAESATRYRQAIGLIEQRPGDQRPKLAETMLALGKAEMAAGETDEANAVLLQVIDLAQEVGDSRLQATVAIQLVDSANVEYRGSDLATIERLQRALEDFPSEDSALRAHCLSSLARLFSYRSVHHGSEPMLQDPIPIAQEALAMARRVADPSVLMHAIYTLIEVRPAYDHVDETLADATEILRLAETVGTPIPKIFGHAAHVNTLFRLGRMDEVDQELDEMQAVAVAHRLPAFIWGEASKRAARTLMRGNLTEAEIQIERALDLGRDSAPEGARFSHLVQTFFLRREQLRLAEIKEQLLEEVGRRPGLLFLQCLLADLYAETGQLDQATNLAQHITKSVIEHTLHRDYWLGTTALLADLYAELGDAQHADELYAMLLPYSALCLCPGGAKVFLGPVPHFLGRLATLLGWSSIAEAHFTDALRMEAKVQTPILEIQTQCALASMLAKEPGRAADTDRLLAAASETANQMDLSRSKRAVGELRRSVPLGRLP